VKKGEQVNEGCGTEMKGKTKMDGGGDGINQAQHMKTISIHPSMQHQNNI